MQVSGISRVRRDEREKDGESDACGGREVRVEQESKPLNGNGRMCRREGAMVCALGNSLI